MNPVGSVLIFAAAGASAYLCCQRMAPFRSRPLWWIALLVAWAVFLVVPVQILAALQIADLVQRVTVRHLAWLDIGITAAVLALILSLPRRAAAIAVEGNPKPFEPIPTYLALAASIVGIAYLFFAINLCTSFPAGSDALNYHLPLAVRWLQEGSLQVPDSKAWRFSLPGNGEILIMLALATGEQWLATLFNWMSCAVLASSLYLLVRVLTRCKRADALAVVLIALSIPMVQFQTFSAFVDLFGAAFILAALVLFFYRYSPERSGTGATQPPKLSLAVILLSALACGMSLGTKPIYWVYGGALFIWILVTLWRERSIHKQQMLVLAGLLLFGMLLPSGFWFARDWLATGSPIYPLQLKVGRHVIFHGYSPSEITPADFADKFVRSRPEWLIYPWTEWLREPGYFPTSYDEGSGLGGAFATFVPLGIALVFYRGRVHRQWRHLYFFLWAWLPLLAFWVLVMHRVLRFGLPLWITACLFAFPLLSGIEAFYEKAAGALLVVSLGTTLAITCLVPLHSLGERIVRHRTSRAQFYGYPTVIDDFPTGSRVLNCTGMLAEDFPLAGKRLTNRVVAAFEVPAQLTEDYVSSERIDYIVEGIEDSRPGDPACSSVPGSISATRIYESHEFGMTWSIYKVRK